MRFLTLSCLILVATAGVAQAGTASSVAGEVRYDAFGEVNDVHASSAAGVVTIRDDAVPVTVGAGCVAVDAHEVTCSFGEDVLIAVEDLDDVVVLDEVSDSLHWQLAAGTGSDTITGCPTCNAIVLAGPGDDTVEGFGPWPLGWIDGESGNDVLTGTAGKNRLMGGTGNDTLVGLGGNDSFYPGPGDDDIQGGAGSGDTIKFGPYPAPHPIVADLSAGVATGMGTDTISGVENLEGTWRGDRLSGDANANHLTGGPGPDVIIGRGGGDVLLGGGISFICCSGNDRLYGGMGRDRLRGSGGNDFLRGGPGVDRLYGGAGRDHMAAKDGFLDFLRGGKNFDRARIDLGLDIVMSVEKAYS